MIEFPQLPRSAKKLILIISENGQITQKDLISAAEMPPKTVRYAINRLKELKLIVTLPNLADMRSSFYQLNPDVDFTVMDATIEDARKVLFAEH